MRASVSPSSARLALLAMSLTYSIALARLASQYGIADPAHAPRQHSTLVGDAAWLPVPLMLALRLAARRPRRALITATGTFTVTTGLSAALTFQAQPPFQLDLGASTLPDPRDVLAASDAALCKSGTTTLEAAVLGVPSVVAYVADPVSYAIGRRVVRAPFMGLANLVADAAVVPELIRHAAPGQGRAAEVPPLLARGGAPAERQRTAYATVRQRLGPPGAAGRTAALVLDLVA